jgi:hypothetical protein
MPSKKSSGSTAKKKSATRRPAAKRTRKPAAERAETAAPAAAVADRLTDVARTIGSKVGGIVAKTKKVLNRG